MISSTKYHRLAMRLGCSVRRGKGDHLIYSHPSMPHRNMTVPDGKSCVGMACVDWLKRVERRTHAKA